MKKILVLLFLGSSYCHADNVMINYAQSFTDYATITKVNPIIETVQKPEKICNTVNSVEKIDNTSYGEAIIGGGIGAVLGHQVGKGRGKDVATALGGITGAIIGSNIGNADKQPTYQNKLTTQCTTQEKLVKMVTGYNVEYVYNGQHRSFISTDELTVGTRLPLNVTIIPTP